MKPIPHLCYALHTVLFLLCSAAAIAQSHEFKLSDISDETPEGIYLTLSPPSAWTKSVESDRVVWRRSNTKSAFLACKLQQYSESDVKSLLYKSQDTDQAGENILTDNVTGEQTGTLTWKSRRVWPNYNYMDAIVAMYGAPNVFKFSLNFEYDNTTGPEIEQEIKNMLGSIKTRGKYVPPEYYYKISTIQNNDTLYGYKNQYEKVVIPPQFHFLDKYYEGLARVGIRKSSLFSDSGSEMRYGFINGKGELVIPAEYEDATWFRNGMAGVKLNSKWGFIDNTGKIVVTPEYDEVGSFVNGLAKVNKGVHKYDWDDVTTWGKWGFIDKTGNVVIPIRYINATDFPESGKAEVQLERGRYFYIDKKGNRVD